MSARLFAVPLPTVDDCRLIALPTTVDERGALTYLEGERDIPFRVQRIYYLYGVRGRRAGHAHRHVEVVVVAVTGGFDVGLDDGGRQSRLRLERPDEGLQVPAWIWYDVDNFGPGAVCLVLASEKYDADDYVRDYQEFLALRGVLA